LQPEERHNFRLERILEYATDGQAYLLQCSVSVNRTGTNKR
jgi:hypothetical protein